MTHVNWDEFKARCSGIHTLAAKSRTNPVLTEKQAARLTELESKDILTEAMQYEMGELLVKKDNGNKIILSDTCIAYLMEEYAWRTEGMVRITKEVMDVAQMQKGTIVECDSLKLLSEVEGVEYKPNCNHLQQRDRVSNDFLSGEVDAYVGESIMTATKIPDIKSTWDYPTFLCKLHEPISNANDWQLKGYGDITGAKDLEVANCLVNTPEHIQFDISRKLMRKLNCISEESPEYIEKWGILERSMNFDRIPPQQRVYKIKIEPMTKFHRDFIYDRVKICREWLWKFAEQRNKMPKLAQKAA